MNAKNRNLWLIKHGRCVLCGGKNDVGGWNCSACKKRRSKMSIATAKRRNERGLCSCCPNILNGRKRICYDCSVKRYRRLKQKKAAV